MMKKSFLTAFAAVVILIACKNGEKEAIIVKESINPNFNVEVDAYVAKKDGFGLYFSEDNTVNFTPENVVWCDIEPQTQAAKAYFEIPEERLPTHIRLDFGFNKEQDSVVIKNIKLNYLKNSFEIKGSEFLNYFLKNDQIKTKIDSVNNTFIIYREGIEYKTPFYYPNENLVVKLRELTGVPAKTQNVQQ